MTIVLSVALLLIFPNKLPPVKETFGSLVLHWFEGLDIVAFFVSILSYYISLGMLAKRLGRRWLLWCGLTIASAPFGFLVSYFWMKNLVEDASAPADEQAVPSPVGSDVNPGSKP